MRKFEQLEVPQGEPDDLTRISGVGAKLAEALNKAGVFHFWQIAALGADDVPELEPLLGFRGRTDWPSWIEQAAALALPEDLEPRPAQADTPAETLAAEDPMPPASEDPLPAPSAQADGSAERGPAADAKARAVREVLVVKAKQDHRRRAGREFGRSETVIPLAELSAAERAAIAGDPVLVAVVDRR